MEKQFVPYELAVKLKELGFDEPCFGIYDGRECKNDGYLNTIYYSNPPYRGVKPSEKNIKYPESYLYKTPVLAPLWQQAFDWFRDIKGLPASIGLTIDNKGYTFLITNLGKIPKVDHLTFPDKLDYGTYEQARHACLEKLIELITINN